MAEINDVLAALDKLDGKIAGISADSSASVKAVKDELGKLGEEQRGLARELLEIKQAAAVPAAELEAGPQSAGAQFVATKAYNDFRARVREDKGVRVALKAAFTSRTETGITDNFLGGIQALDGVYNGAFAPLSLEQVIPHIPTSAPAVSFVREIVFTNGAKVVPEGTDKPETTVGVEKYTVNVETVAAWTKITEQLAADAPAVQAYIDTRMRYGLAQAVETALISGDGNNNLSGFQKQGNFTDYSTVIGEAGEGDNLLDFVLKAKTELEKVGFPPRVLVLNPSDWVKLATLKDANGKYILDFGVLNQRALWGLQVVTTPAIHGGNYLLSDFARTAVILDNSDVAVEIDRVNDDFTKNLLTLRVERRLGLAVLSPKGISGGDLKFRGGDV